MSNLRKAAQDSIDLICQSKLCEINSMSSRAESIRLLDKAIEALRQALANEVGDAVQDEPENPIAWIMTADQFKRPPEFYRERPSFVPPTSTITPLYTTPPSVDALIAEAIEKHDDEMAYAKTVNMRTQAQPYLDTLIAEIDGLTVYSFFTVQPILDKYRSAK